MSERRLLHRTRTTERSVAAGADTGSLFLSDAHLACWSPIYRLGRWECRAGRVRVWRAQARAARVRVGIYCGVPATRRDGAARGEKGGDSGAGRRLGYVAGEWEGAGDCRLAFL